MSPLTVGIAGSGIGGLAVATLLARAGHAVTVLERFAAPRPVGSGLVLQPVGLAALERLGLRAAAEAAGARIEALEGHDSRSGRRVLDVRYDAGGAGRAGLGLHRAALFDLLHRAALAAGAKVAGGFTVAGAEPRAGLVLAADGRRAGPFDLLVDALGAGSPLARDPGRLLPFGALWATVDWPGPGDPPRALRQSYRAARQMAGILPVGRLPGDPVPKVAVFWSLPVAWYGLWRSAPLADWKAEAGALWPDFARFLAPLARHDDLVMASYRHRTLARPVSGRLVHLGDAWHATSPQLGQGANMALLDAVALADALAAEEGVAAALAEFRRRRAAHVWLYQLSSRVFTPMYQSESRILPVLRDRILAPLAGLPGLRWLLGRLVSGDLVPPVRG